MAGTPEYADISSFQGTSIDWKAYAAWARQWDGTVRICMKATEGVGFTDPRFQANRAGALAAGIDSVLYYHYARPDLGNSAVDEANWLFHVVGNVRDGDAYMLDYEQNTSAATAQWAYDFLSRIETLTGRTPTIYASTSFVRTHLQDQRLSRFPLILANWTYDANARPPCPTPWTSYLALQYSDKATIPGIQGAVDANVYLGVTTPVPTTTPGGENAVFIDNIDQLEPGETEDACVAFSAANVFYSTQPGTQNHYTAEQVDQLADKWYVKDTGSITSSAGLTDAQLHAMLDGMGLQWEDIPITSNGPANDEAVRTALRARKLVIICAAEDSFFDLEIGRPPYNWNTKPYNHCIVASGLITSGPWAGNVWVRDTVAVSGGYPPSTKRPYDLAKMQYVSLTAVIPSWLKGGTTMPIPAGWQKQTVNGETRLICPNGHYAIRGFEQYIENDPNWNPANTLNEEEYQTPQVQLHNTGLGPGARMTTRDGTLWYTQAKGVIYEPFLGLELKACYDMIAAQQTQIATLKAQQPTPAPVDTTALQAAINAIPDAIAPAVAQALVEAKKL